MFDSYKHFLETPGYNKVIGQDFLIVEFKCPIKEELFTAWSECHSIVYVLSGKKKWITPQRNWLVKAGQSIFVRKGAFKNQQYFEEGFCVLMFFMKDDFIRCCFKEDISNDNLVPKMIAQPDMVYGIHVSETLQYVYNSFFSYLKGENKIPQKIIELKFREMLVNICSADENRDVLNLMHTLAENSGGSLQQIMEEQFIYNLSVDDYARLCGRSVSSFKRDFKKIYQMSPGKWVVLRRLETARNLLLKTDDTVQQICYDTGFESDSHFVRTFKNTFGQTPNQWRSDKKSSLSG